MNILEARRRTLGKGVYKKTVEGNPAIAQGSLARMYPGITMQGWTEQDSTTGAQLINLNEMQIGGINGVAGVEFETKNRIRIGYTPVTAGTVYTLSGYSPYVIANSHTYDSLKQRIGSFSSGSEISEGGAYIKVSFAKSDQSDFTENDLDELKYTIMLNEGSTALPYEPYTGNKPSPSPEYPQPITSAGKYNEDTQKWEYEITIANEQTDPDKNQTVTLTSDRPLTKWDKLEKRNGQWGWVYKSMEITLDGSEITWRNYPAYKGYYCTDLPFPGKRREGYAENIIVDTNMSKTSTFSCWLGVGNNFVYIINAPTFNSELPDSGLQDWKDWLSENPITILTYADEETFVPLSESEQEAMNALHTFRPTTVLSNDCDCNMTLTYKTKKSLEVAT